MRYISVLLICYITTGFTFIFSQNNVLVKKQNIVKLSLENKNPLVKKLINDKQIYGVIYNRNSQNQYFSIIGNKEDSSSVHANSFLNVIDVGAHYYILFKSNIMTSNLKIGILIYNKITHDFKYKMIATEILDVYFCQDFKEEIKYLKILHLNCASFIEGIKQETLIYLRGNDIEIRKIK